MAAVAIGVAPDHLRGVWCRAIPHKDSANRPASDDKPGQILSTYDPPEGTVKLSGLDMEPAGSIDGDRVDHVFPVYVQSSLPHPPS